MSLRLGILFIRAATVAGPGNSIFPVPPKNFMRSVGMSTITSSWGSILSFRIRLAIQQAQHKYLRDDQVRLLRPSRRNTSLVQKRCRNERLKAKIARESVTIYPENGIPASSPVDGCTRTPSHFAALPSSPNRKRGIWKRGSTFWKKD
jgi:hypothetical protein